MIDQRRRKCHFSFSPGLIATRNNILITFVNALSEYNRSRSPRGWNGLRVDIRRIAEYNKGYYLLSMDRNRWLYDYGFRRGYVAAKKTLGKTECWTERR